MPAQAEEEPATSGPVEVVSERTETSDVFQNPDGSRTAKLYTEPVRLKRDGGWADIDYTLERTSTGNYQPKVAPADVTIGGGGSNDAARVDFGDGKSATLSWPTKLPEPVIEGNTATYKLSAATDLIVKVTIQGVATHIRLNRKPEVDDPSWRLNVKTRGIEVTQDNDSSLTFEQDGRQLGDVSHLVAWDSRLDGEGDHANVVPVTGELRDAGTDDSQVLELSASQSFLDDPQTQYPVIIDPDINAVAFLRDIWVRRDTTYTTPAGSSAYRLLVGVVKGSVALPEPNTYPARSYLAWNNSQLSGKTIVRAEMGLFQYGANSCSTRVVQAWPLASGFNGNTTQWTTKPSERNTEGTGTSTNPGGDACGTANNWVKFDVTAMARKWATNAYANHGVSVRIPVSGTTESDISYGRRFCSSQPTAGETNAACYSGRTPYLKITYNGPPGTPAVPTTPTTTVNGVVTTTSTKPTWTTKATDPESSRVKYEVQVHSSTAGTAASLVTSCTTALVSSTPTVGTSASCTPSTALNNGSTYYARAKAIDEYNVGGSWSGYRQVRVDTNTTPPPAEAKELYDEVGARKGATRLDFAAGDRVNATVDVGTGNLNVVTDDLKLPGISGDTKLGLSYNSLLVPSTSSARVGVAGLGWQMRLGQDTRLVEKSNGNIAYLAPGGVQAQYDKTDDGYDSPKGFKNKLKKTSDGWELKQNGSKAVSRFNTDGRLYEIRDGNNRPIEFQYANTAPKNLTVIASTKGTDAARKANFTFTGNALTRMSQTSGNSTREVTYTYNNPQNAAPLLTSMTDLMGRTTEFGYDSSNRLSTITSTNDVVTQFTYDTQARVTKVVRDVGGIEATTRFAYVPAQNGDKARTRVADPKTDPNAAIADVPFTSYAINAKDGDADEGPQRVAEVRDQKDRKRGKTYTPSHDTQSTSNNADEQSTNSFEANNGESMTGSNSPTGASSSTTYDENDPNGNTHSPTSTTDGAGSQKTMTYDGAGNQTSAGTGGGGASGDVKAEVDYNDDGTPKFSASPGGTLDPTANIDDSEANKLRTVYRRDGNHQLIEVDPPGSSIGASQMTYDTWGRQATFTDGRNKVTTFSYDNLDRTTKIDYSDSTPDVTYTYDDAGNTASRVDGTGTTTFGYDKLNRMTSRTAPGAGGEVTYAYDKANNMTQATDAAGTTSYVYDAANQLQVQTTSGGKRVEFKYDNDGNRTDTWFDTDTDTTNDNVFAAHTKTTYDASNRAKRTYTSRNNSDSDRIFDTSYCYATYIAGEDCPTGKDEERDTSLIQYSFDHTKNSANSDDDRTIYTYDFRNRLEKATNFQGHTWDYQYDKDSNVTSIKKDGTTVRGPIDHTRTNQIDAEFYTYDAAGNRTTSGGEGTLTYDGANRMIKLDQAGSAPILDYTYAGTDMKELVKRELSSGETFTYTYGRSDNNGLPLVETFNKSGGTAPGRWGIDYDSNGTPIALKTPGGVEHYFALDRQASVVALINQNGTKTADYTYSPYGQSEVTGAPAEAAEINFYRHTLGFTDKGDADNKGTGFVKHGIRWYDTETGAWTTQDPMNAVLDLGNGNRYLYAGADPINNVDPTGYWYATTTFSGCIVVCLEVGAKGKNPYLGFGIGADVGASVKYGVGTGSPGGWEGGGGCGVAAGPGGAYGDVGVNNAGEGSAEAGYEVGGGGGCSLNAGYTF